ncbi:MAG: hypothetical protein Q9227_007638 [Pyrenula ochraceoflavens]
MVVRKPVPGVGVTPSPAPPPDAPPYPVTPTSPRPSSTHIPPTIEELKSKAPSDTHQLPALNSNSYNDAQASVTDNPWAEETRYSGKKDTLPSVLQVGAGQNHVGKGKELDGVPGASHPGPQETTPRSSFESQESDDSWANIGEEDEGHEEQSKATYQDSRILQFFAKGDGPYRGSLGNEESGQPTTETAKQDEDGGGGAFQHQAHQTPSPPQPLSKNPFRRKMSNSPSPYPHPTPPPPEDALIPPSQFQSNKGKEKAYELSKHQSSLMPEPGQSDRAEFSVSQFAHSLRLSDSYQPQPIPPEDNKPTDNVPQHSPLAPADPSTALHAASTSEKHSLSMTPSSNAWAGTGNDEYTADDHYSDAKQDFSASQQDLIDFDDAPSFTADPNNKLPENKVNFDRETDPESSRQNIQSTTLSSNLVSESQLAKLREQRKETYQIKHFDWLDPRKGEITRTSMLIQNKNGPCPLLALVNALILSIDDSAVNKTLRSREHVSLGLIIESLMDELTTDARGLATGPLPDVDELNRFLLMLHNGMNANPRLAATASTQPNLIDVRNSVMPQFLNDDRKPGSFEETADVKLYSAFSIPLVHGWLPSRSDPAHQAFARSAATYEDAQTIQFGEEELEAKLSQGGLTPSEQQLLQDIVSIKSFFNTYPTQLTTYGLRVINDSLYPGSFAILFRNDHFSTIFKHPDTGRLFVLVTDAGYSSHDEVIWESLVDISNKHSEFYSGDFRPVGNITESSNTTGNSHPSTWSAKQGPNTPGPAARQDRLSPSGPSQPGLSSPSSPLEEQADADFALALQLQDEEEARAQEARSSNRRRASTNPPPQPPRPNRSSTRHSQTDIRPLVPPRNRPNPAVNRSSELDHDEDAPPSYAEASKAAAYQPPVGHPSHESHTPGSGTLRPNPGRAGPTQQVSSLTAGRASRVQSSSSSEYGPYGGNTPTGRRYGEQQLPYSSQQMAGVKQRDKDCIVM